MKKRYLSIAIAALGASVISASAFADGGHPYVTAGVGYGRLDTPNKYILDNSATDRTRDKGGVAWQVGGGYLFNLNQQFSYGGELDYTNFAKNEYKATSGSDKYKVSYDSQAISLLGVAKYNVTDRFDILGKAGLAYVMQDMDVKDPDNRLSKGKDRKQLKPEVAVGAGFDVTNNINLGLTYDHIFGDSVNFKTDGTDLGTGIASVNSVMANITYKF